MAIMGIMANNVMANVIVIMAINNVNNINQ
jgi:hypothetical protein